MNNLKLNYWVDVGLAISFFSSFITGLIKFPEFMKLVGFSNKNLPMKSISSIHDWSGIILGSFVIMHLILHWRVIILLTKRRMFKTKSKV